MQQRGSIQSLLFLVLLIGMVLMTLFSSHKKNRHPRPEAVKTAEVKQAAAPAAAKPVVVKGPVMGPPMPTPDDLYPNLQGVTPIYVSTTKKPIQYALHVLFIGNSYTFRHSMVKQLVDIASSDPENSTQFFVRAITLPNVSLQELWAEGTAARAITTDHWDYVVLQPHSNWALSSIEKTSDYAGRFDKLIKQAGARTMIEMVWPDKPGSHWYTDKSLVLTKDPGYVLHKIDYQTHKLAQSLGGNSADVGLYWGDALVKLPAIDLYEPDGRHPNITGSYLIALVFYKTLTGHDISKITFDPPGVAPDVAAKIRGIIEQDPTIQAPDILK